MASSELNSITYESLPQLLEHDTKVKVAGVDADGLLRGKVMSKEKFLSIAKSGFGFCSGIFRWDMLDDMYPDDLLIKGKNTIDMPDMLAFPDLKTFRRIPWENNIPFFLVSFHDPIRKTPMPACPRGLLKSTMEKLKAHGFGAMAGVEYEFAQFRVPPADLSGPASPQNRVSIAKYLENNSVSSLPPLTEGRFGYSITRSQQNSEYFYSIFDSCKKFNCDIEGWHSETGPGVFEAALSYDEVQQLADKASLFKHAVKSIAIQYGITPCFMAKPWQNLPGNSGHMHISLVDAEGKNIFAREEKDPAAPYEDVANLSDLGRHFLAGLLDGLPDIMPIFAPTINSYKRLDERFWAPVTVSWGLEHRASSIRIIAPPTSKPGGTRFEVRVPGADTNPYYVLATIVALGWRGIEKKLAIRHPPMAKEVSAEASGNPSLRLARTLNEANERFLRKDSVAREIFSDEFVDHFGCTRRHEIRLFEQTVTDWEFRRYIETV
ncbi:Type-1 glutamine synthetase 2 [Golovinomyces cichoracearum]|uniref:Glutamine synthetase n=1 Tax=Golovinomyces cichoracearum TaxID=62708 RepID=A0A420J1Q2_9PEZI|nr:Type-1 glutamine synthetase 2 [Golovinomyces cichoracearum]